VYVPFVNERTHLGRLIKETPSDWQRLEQNMSQDLTRDMSREVSLESKDLRMVTFSSFGPGTNMNSREMLIDESGSQERRKN